MSVKKGESVSVGGHARKVEGDIFAPHSRGTIGGTITKRTRAQWRTAIEETRVQAPAPKLWRHIFPRFFFQQTNPGAVEDCHRGNWGSGTRPQIRATHFSNKRTRAQWRTAIGETGVQAPAPKLGRHIFPSFFFQQCTFPKHQLDGIICYYLGTRSIVEQR